MRDMVSTAAGVRVVALEARDGIVYTLAFVETQRTRGAAGTPLGIRASGHPRVTHRAERRKLRAARQLRARSGSFFSDRNVWGCGVKKMYRYTLEA